MESLKFEQIDSRQSSIKTAHTKTCEWLLTHSAYQDWINRNHFIQHHGFLWINGKPGAGKSTLMKFAYLHTKNTSSDATISFFFNARGDVLEKSTAGMHRSLLVQLLETFPDLQAVLDNPGAHHINDIQTLRNIFSLAITKLGHRRLTCFIDALDECDQEEVQDMITYFEGIGESAINREVKPYVCFSTRHYPYIHVENGRKLTLEDQTGHEEDLERYIKSHLKVGTKKQIDEVRSEILQKAAGVFLWVVLVVSILNDEFKGGRLFAVKRRLKEIPPRLSDLFKDILTRDSKNMGDLLLSIQWILFAKRPLRIQEFYFAVVSGLNADSLSEWDPEEVTTDDINRFVLSSSKGLAETTRSKQQTVQFIHESVRDFLIKDNGFYDLWPDLAADFSSKSHERLKQCCYNYMQTDVSRYITFDRALPKSKSTEAVDLRLNVLGKFPFLQYATDNIMYHADMAAAGVCQDRFLQTFNTTSWINLNNLFEKHEVRRYTPSASLLYILAETNMANLIKSVLHFHPGAFHKRGERYQYPFFAAIANSHRSAIKALLDLEHNPAKDNITTNLVWGRGFVASKGQTPLSWASSNGHKEIVQLLLDRGAETDAKDNDGQSPLWNAASNGNKEIVQLLLDGGAEIDAKNEYGQSPLWNAACKGHKEIVQLLLDRGAEIDAKYNDGQLLLWWAAWNGHKEIVQLLLDRGAEIDAKDNDSQTPLWWAASNGHKEIVQLLLDRGAEIDAKDNDGQLPLWGAAYNGHKEIVQLLFEKGANRRLC